MAHPVRRGDPVENRLHHLHHLVEEGLVVGPQGPGEADLVGEDVVPLAAPPVPASRAKERNRDGPEAGFMVRIVGKRGGGDKGEYRANRMDPSVTAFKRKNPVQ
jgi:hypothetical protein